jgi:hypothetical protein
LQVPETRPWEEMTAGLRYRRFARLKHIREARVWPACRFS